ncbi:MAG: formyltetrahydrofolate deformylase [Phycicoccus sp.]|jgi:formyltetrahydrofolate deformylase|uniref:formyltetrahydrofolate deformylase n=1 Tax=Phycicoccus TaxID=367298 RepID=UPI00258DA082|nr:MULTISPECIES: formyltetrahydrofolate deformylase [Phycicoccus]MBK8730956.1 formyltetrahydrofolate deformylase [Tetrasphaera sp.]MCA0323170.1 formyltetrahydrofolate deformylase [Actinomycetota bacterium]MCO5303169.1 formyltetrahydrofolate deformylase [Phycicoccus sp.]HPF76190.1 formyltetrahydrofolate deformylase [Phycicoccus elongatus]HRC17387.1 formyltetrahydrofolate deformylase [Phycicoccus elongatus]
MTAREHVLLLSCPDRPGIVAAVTATLAAHDANIEDSQQYKDSGTGRFFMRIHFTDPTGEADWHALLEPAAAAYAMEWDVRPAAQRCRTLILVSKFGHCLNDLLFRWQSGNLDIDIVGVVSNHEDMRGLVESYAVPFHHIPVTGATKDAAEAELLELVEAEQVDLVVLARYMQILSDGASRALEGRVINIHHSFLPSFKGAKPYHQAYDRGVKIVGATAHYVTADLDEGPIIEQDVHRVDHRMAPEALVRAGEECESRVLARAVRWHAEHRVVLNGHRTVVFA